MVKQIHCDVCSKEPKRLIYLTGKITTDNSDADLPSQEFGLFQSQTTWAFCSKECFDSVVFRILDEAMSYNVVFSILDE